jgi:signal transduction histidine kinase
MTDHGFLSIFEPSAAARLLEHGRIMEFEDGSVIFREKDPADALFVVLQGQVSLTTSAAGRQEYIAMAGEDECFGEFGVLDGESRSAEATAIGDVRLLRIPRDVFIAELGGAENNPAIRLMIRTIRKMRQSNRQYVEELLRREKFSLLGQVVLGVVHDFRSPFSVILMATELMQSGRADPEAMKECCALIVEQVERVNAMAEEVLDYSRGNTSLRLEKVELGQFLRRFVDLNKRFLHGRGVALSAAIQESCMIEADPGRLQRVLQNLVYNATDAMGDGGSIDIDLDRPDADSVRIHVKDSGPGIPDEIRERLFEPFQTKGKAKGLGLGLAIAKQFVQSHGGELTFDSEKGKGTIFHILLPLRSPGSKAPSGGQ